MLNVLANKFSWANVMANQKGVVFRVSDTSMASEFGPGAAAQEPGKLKLKYSILNKRY